MKNRLRAVFHFWRKAACGRFIISARGLARLRLPIFATVPPDLPRSTRNPATPERLAWDLRQISCVLYMRDVLACFGDIEGVAKP